MGSTTKAFADFAPPVYRWDDVYSEWQYVLGDKLIYPIRDVHVCSPNNGLKIRQNIIDWWPNSEFEQRIKALTEHGSMGAYWAMRKGTTHTAEMLIRAAEDKDLTAAIWLGAAVKDLRDDKESRWKAPSRRILEGLENMLRKQLEQRSDLWWWHFAARRALPEQVHHTVIEHEAPEGIFEMLHLIKIAVCTSAALWTIVRVSHADAVDDAVPKV